MELEDILKGKNGGEVEFQAWFGEKGFSNISSADLDKIIKTYTSNVFAWHSFMEIYIAKKNEESAKKIERWTIRMGRMTIAILMMTAVMLAMTGIMCYTAINPAPTTINVIDQ